MNLNEYYRNHKDAINASITLDLRSKQEMR